MQNLQLQGENALVPLPFQTQSIQVCATLMKCLELTCKTDGHTSWRLDPATNQGYKRRTKSNQYHSLWIRMIYKLFVALQVEVVAVHSPI